MIILVVDSGCIELDCLLETPGVQQTENIDEDTFWKGVDTCRGDGLLTETLDHVTGVLCRQRVSRLESCCSALRPLPSRRCHMFRRKHVR